MNAEPPVASESRITMTKLVRLPFWNTAALVVALTAAPGMAARGADLALKRVMLSTGGIGYVEYAAEIDGPTELSLDVPLEQVDDILKSLVVFDSAGGVGGLELPGPGGAVAAFGDVPFGPEALASPVEYLNSLRGVALEVRGPRPMTGRLLRAEEVHEPGPRDQPGAGVRRTRVTLLAAEGIRQFVLEDAESVQVADPALRGRIDRALEALRRDAGRSTRHLTLRSSGTGKRMVRVGYVAAAALWKTSYRLVLGPQGADGGKARLQGWAVLENATGADWNGVQLSLQYGNPVSFRQAIYRSYFVPRPEVAVEIMGHVLPDVDTGARAADSVEAPRGAPLVRPAPAPMMAKSMAAGAPPPPPPAPAMAPPAEEASAAEGAVDTVFTLPSPVVLASGHSASVPILDREVPARRIGLVPFNRPHPIAAVRITNDTATSLPAGVLTLYETGSAAAYAGDARLGGLPTGESRLLSFAEDLRTAVTWRIDEGTTIAAVTAANGVLRVDQRLRWTAKITLAGPASETRDLLIEIPRRDGATLVPDQSPKPSEETATAWRLPVTLAAGEKRDITVQTDRILRQQMSLLNDDQVVVRLLGMQGLDARARQTLEKIAALRSDVSARTADLERAKAQRDGAERNEQRVRDNLGAVPANDAMHGKLVRQLEAEEARIAALDKAIEQAEAAVAKAREALATAVRTLTL